MASDEQVDGILCNYETAHSEETDLLLNAEASLSEKPDAVIPHVGIRSG
jgi:hypothetical protein